MTRLRKLMLEELQRRNFSSDIIRGCLGAVEQFARYSRDCNSRATFGNRPDRLGPDHIRQWQAHLLHERKLAVGTVVNRVAPEYWFSILSRSSLRGASFTSAQQLATPFDAIDKFVTAYNADAAPCEWTKTVVHPTGPKAGLL